MIGFEKLFLWILLIVALIGLLMAWQLEKDANYNKRFDTCYKTFSDEKLPREMYNDFMSDCFGE